MSDFKSAVYRNIDTNIELDHLPRRTVQQEPGAGLKRFGQCNERNFSK